MRSNVGIREVAVLAGVSTATVSRALNFPDRVSGPLRAQVAKAVKASGYVPNAGARALSTNRSLTIGAVIPTVDNALFAVGIDAAEQLLAERGYQLLIATSRYQPEREWQAARTMLSRGVDGFLFMGDNHAPRLRTLLRAQGRPWVNLGVWRADWKAGDAASVGFDNEQAGAQIGDFLLQLGHRRIGMLAGVSRDNDRAAGRIAGLRRTLAAAGVSLQVSEHAYTVEEGRKGLQALLAAKPASRRPTAIACGNDVLAFGALAQARAQGIEVPRQLSIVGFDDLELARHQDPPLTTVRVDTRQMWEHGVQAVLAALTDGAPAQQRKTDCALIVRGSTAAAPG